MFFLRKKLSWYELIPIFSFAALRGKCGKCKSKISWQYPLVEFFTGLLFLAVYLKLNGFYFLNSNNLFSLGNSVSKYSYFYYLAVFSILIVITVYDLRHKIIPDLLVFSFAFISLIYLVASKTTSDVVLLANWDLLAGPILATPFFLMWLLSGGRWMGLGDAKLALGMGWFLGLISGASAVIFGFWIGAVVSIFLLLAQKLNLSGKNLQLKAKYLSRRFSYSDFSPSSFSILM